MEQSPHLTFKIEHQHFLKKLNNQKRQKEQKRVRDQKLTCLS